MKKIVTLIVLVCAGAAAAAYVMWGRGEDIRVYAAAELVGLSCEALGARHEEVIFAFHDAELAHYRRAGSFHDDLGLPMEEVLPMIVLMRWVLEDSALNGATIAAAVSPGEALIRSGFYSKTSAICAANPQMPAVAAIGQAAEEENVITYPTRP